MYKWLDKITHLILKFAYDSISVFLLFALLARSLYPSFEINGLYEYTAFLFILSALVNWWLSSLNDDRRSKFNIIGIGGMVVALFMGTRFNPEYSFSGQLIMGGYFIIVWMNGIKFIHEDDNTHYFSRRFFQTAMGMIFITITVGIGQTQWIVSVLRPFFVVFFMTAIMILISMNLKAAYKEESANRMQVSRRILVFNVITILVFTVAIVGLVSMFSTVELGWLESILRFVLIPIGQLIGFFSGRVRARAIKKQGTESGVPTVIAESVDKMREDLREEFPVSTDTPWDQYIEWGAIIIVILGLIVLMYYLTKRLERNKKNPEMLETDEVRETLLTGQYLKALLKDKVDGISKKINGLLGRDSENLPPIRLIYKTYLQYISNKGVSVSADLTPNEILRLDESKRGKKADPPELTRIYNEYRYGMVDEEMVKDTTLEAFKSAITSKKM